MPLETFKLPKPDVRLVVLGDTVYKIKLNLRKNAHTQPRRHSDRCRRAEQVLLCGDKMNQEDIEKSVSAVLGSGLLQPIETNNLIIYPYRKRWETADNLLFSQHSKPLKASPYTYTFYIEEKKAQQMLQAKGTVVRNNDKEPLGLPSGTRGSSTSPKRQKHDTVVVCQSSTNTETHTRQRSSHQTFKHPESLQRNRSLKPNATRKRKHSATGYEQKDRHDIEDRELQEHLRLQAMATPVDEEAAVQALDQELSNSSALQTVLSVITSPVTAVKKLFGRPN